MTAARRPDAPIDVLDGVDEAQTVGDLARLLRRLRRRHARQHPEHRATYRKLADETGWSTASVGEYFTGRTLPPADRFDILVQLLGATAEEQGVLATVHDDIEERQRAGRRPGAPAVSAVGVARPAVAQLPPDVRGFVGRREELVRLDGALADLRDRPSGPVICTVTGMAGVGKTTLVVHWAHRVSERFRGGWLYVDLRGFEPSGMSLSPAAAIRGILDAYSVPAESIPSGLAAQAALFRGLLIGRPTLLVLDNARDAEQVRPLLPDSSDCLVLVTSRDQLTDLVVSLGAYPLTLDVLEADEAGEFLAERLGPARVAAEAEGARKIIRSCAGLPLALAVVAARAATHPDFPLAELANELRYGEGELDAADIDAAPGVWRTFAPSYLTLRPDAAHLFRLLSLYPGPLVTVAAAASVAGVPILAARRMLGELARTHMVTEQAPGRYAVHDLLRSYAAQLARTVDPQDQHRAASLRMLDHLLHTADAGDQLLDEFRSPVELAHPLPGVTITRFADRDQAYAWFVSEQETLVSAVCQAEQDGIDDRAWQLAWVHADFLYWRSQWSDLAVASRVALAAAQRLSCAIGQAHAHRGLAGASTAAGRHQQAQRHLEDALHLFEQAGSRVDQAHINRNLALVSQNDGRHAEALHYLRASCELYETLGDESGYARALEASGWSHLELGDHARAIECCERALDLLRRNGDPSGEAYTWGALGYVHDRRGDHQQAIVCLKRADALFRSIGGRTDHGEILEHLGDAYAAVGNVRNARRAWQDALRVFDQVGVAPTGALREKLRRPGSAAVEPAS